jgi:hypothetical protein
MKFMLSLLIVLLNATVLQAEVTVSQSGESLTIANDFVQLNYDLSRGVYEAIDYRDGSIVVANGSLQINDLSTTAPGAVHDWTARAESDELGIGKAVLIECRRPDQVALLFEITLYEGQGYFVFAGGIENTTDDVFQLMSIKPLDGASLFGGVGSKDMSQNFRLLDGNGGGEPLEWGVKEYTAIYKGNYCQSRNNILMTFGENETRRSLVMGGLTYHDFEKFATIQEPRRIELTGGENSIGSLVGYLNLSEEQVDQAASGETLRLPHSTGTQGNRYHELWGDELATSVSGTADGLILEAENLDDESAYYLGFSWWHTGADDRIQSVSVDSGPDTARHLLVENKKLPTWNNKAKIDPEQVELLIPADIYASGNMRILVESNSEQPQPILNEIWLRKGPTLLNPTQPLQARAALHDRTTVNSGVGIINMLPQELTPINETLRPRHEMLGTLYAEDPVGKRVNPGERYLPDDRFYLDFTTDNPFENLEQYGRSIQKAQQIDLDMYDFPTVCLWYANHRGYGGGIATNDTVGAVHEMDVIKASGFLNYSRAAVRLVPDCYSNNNQQGWWDDEHFQMHGSTNLDGFEGGTYKAPYETSEKWGQAIIERGGIPLTYCQTGFRSEDYAHAFPEHMLFNSATAWMNPSYERPLDDEEFWGNAWTKSYRVWGYDYTDPDFVEHMRQVYADYRSGGIKGLMYDYPARGWASGGGMEDPYATTARAYRDIFQLAQDGLGDECYLHERNMERGSDITLGLVASQRTENDTDRISPGVVTRCGLRWYKNRVVVNYDTDSKNIYRMRDDQDAVRGVLTMSYVTTGRLLLANSFEQLASAAPSNTPGIIRDMTRIYPFHTTPKTARPVDAFMSKYPRVYDFEVSPKWHQLTLFNTDSEEESDIEVTLAGSTAEGCLGLDPEKEYYLYDFWNDRFAGKIAGDTQLVETLRPGEVRMLSVHEAEDRPQFIATDRHIMQGYVDLSDVQWSSEKNRLSGTSQVVVDDPYVVTIATNGYTPLNVELDDPNAQATIEEVDNQLVKLTITSDVNAAVRWSLGFEE